MTNEELALKIRAGDKDLISLLWRQIKPFLYRYCKGYFIRNEKACSSAGVMFDDLLQESYFAVLVAIRAYNPRSGYKFLTYLNYPLMNVLNEIVGYRTVAQQNSPLNSSVRFEKPLKGADNVLMGDVIPDKYNNIDILERHLYNEQLHNDLIWCMNNLSDDERGILFAKYFANKSIDDIASQLNISPTSVRNIEYRGLRKMRTGKNYVKLRAYEYDIISTHAYNSSFNTWKNSGYSSTEYTAFKLLEFYK